MSVRRYVLLATCVPLFLTLTACPPGLQTADETSSDFFVASAGQGGTSGYTPQGWGWKPGSHVEISIFNEPDGPGSASTSWKKILDETVDPTSLFGFNAGAPFYPVRRSICGNPEQGQFLVAMAKNTNTGKIRMTKVPVDIYFTFQPCPH